jgi:psiF repeat
MRGFYGAGAAIGGKPAQTLSPGFVIGPARSDVMCWNPLRDSPQTLNQGNTMKKLLSLLALGLSLSLGAAQAADAPIAKAKTPQQMKMAQCNADAKDKKGDERKAFMKGCLSAKPATAASAPMMAATPEKKMTQQEKMKVCNKDAGDKKLKGDELKAFMKDCLSK